MVRIVNWSKRLPIIVTAGITIVQVLSLSASEVGKYQLILDRNAFALKPYTPPVVPVPPKEPENDGPELKELDLQIAGVSVTNGEKRAWLAMMVPSDLEDEGPVRRFFPFKEGDIHYGVRVKDIGTSGDVQVQYNNEPILLTFETHGTKHDSIKQQRTVGRKGIRSIRATGRQQRHGSIRTATNQRGTTARGSARSPTLRTVQSGSTGSTLRNPSLRTRKIPKRPVRSSSGQSKPKLYNTREEQRALIEINRKIAEQEGRRLPPIPTFR